MLRWSRTITMLAAVLTFGCSAPTSVFYDSPPSLPANPVETANLSRVVDEALSAFDASNLSIPENLARNSAVKVIRPFENGHGSGTYVKMHGRFAVITAAHVVEGHTTMVIAGRDSERVIGRVIYTDDFSDLAIVLVPPLKTRIALPYRPKKNETNLIGASITYTGFPGRHDLLTIRGHVASLEKDMIVANMFGWFGASGSGVVDQHGRFLGVVSGIDVGNWMVPLPLDSIVWVAPIWELDEQIIKARIKSEPALEVFKSFPGAAAPRRGGLRD